MRRIAPLLTAGEELDMTRPVEREITLPSPSPALPDQPAGGQHLGRVLAEAQAYVPVGGHDEAGAIEAAAGAAPAIGLAVLVRGPAVGPLSPGVVMTLVHHTAGERRAAGNRRAAG